MKLVMVSKEKIEKNQLEAWVRRLVPHLNSKVILLLAGEVGAGKTTVTQALVKELGLTPAASPSFAFHHRYSGSKVSLDHIDLYRVESEDDLESIGFWDLFNQDSGLIAIEWGQLLNFDHLPLGWKVLHLQIQKVDETIRLMELQELILS